MRRTASVVVLAVALAACETPTSSAADVARLLDGGRAQPEVTTNDWGVFNQTFSPCGVELIAFTGALHVVNTWTTTPTGSVAASGRYEMKASGLGQSSGALYQYIDQGVYRWYFESFPTTPQVQTITTNGRLVGNGPSGNMMLRYRVRVVVNPNGDVVVDASSLVAECS